jgi:hypothetical protein
MWSTDRAQAEERYLAVYQFYYANDQRLKEVGHSWFAEFLDEIFVDLCSCAPVKQCQPITFCIKEQ